MAAPGLCHGGEALKAIAGHGAACRQAPFGENRHSALEKLLTLRSLMRTGLPSCVVSTAATKGVLPAAPRSRPPERSLPKISIVDLDAAGQLPVGIRPASGDDHRAPLLFPAVAALKLGLVEPLLKLHHVASHRPPSQEKLRVHSLYHNGVG